MWHKQSFTQFWSQSDAYSRRSSLKLTYIHHPLVVCTHQICCAVAVPIALSQDRLLHGHNRLVNWTPCASKLKIRDDAERNDRQRETQPQPKFNTNCRYYQAGTCKFGNRCNYIHAEGPMDISLRTPETPAETIWRPQARPRTPSSSEERSRYSSSSSEYREAHNSRSRNKDRTQPKKPILKQQTRYPSSSSSRDNRHTTSTNQENRKRQDKSRSRHERTPPPSTSHHQTRRKRSRSEERHRSRRRSESLDNETINNMILALQKTKRRK